MAEIPQVEVTDLADDVLLLDVREPNEYVAGHAPNALACPLGEVRASFQALPDPEGVLYVICRSGIRSQMAAEYLASQGREAANVVGGTTAWVAAGKPLVSETGDEPAVVAPATIPPTEI